jgi:hypothetical protein
MLVNTEPVANREVGVLPLEYATLHRWPAFDAHFVDSARREALEHYISSVFHASYGATILEYLPLLFSLQREGAFSASLGLRGAAGERLFCEQYLDASIEVMVCERYGVASERRRIMEMGNLAASTQGDGALLYLLATAVIHEAGITHLTFAANRAVRLSISRCGFTPLIIAPASAERLGAKAAYWGSYYRGKPMVMLADLALTMRQARAQPAMAALLRRYRVELEQLADAVRQMLL